MKLISLFDGIGGFPLAWANVTGQAPADLHYQSSEIEPWPMAVVRQRFPHVEELGSVTTIQSDRLRSADDHIITFGSPCQDLSVAGRGAGLAGERSGLFHEAMRLVRDIRPKYFIWENVAGAFSSNNGNDFAAVLQSTADIGYDAVWTTLDAQWCGVPQRRRRVFLLGVRDGIPAGADIFSFGRRATEVCRDKVQLIRESRSRNTATSGEAGQETPDNPQESPGGRSFVIDRAAFNQGENALYEPRIEEGDVMSSLMSRGPHAVGQHPDPVAIDGYNQTVADTTQSCRASRSDADHVGMVAYNDPVAYHRNASCQVTGAPVVRSLRASAEHSNQFIVHPLDAEGGATSDKRQIVATGSFWDGGQVSQCIDAVTHKGQTMPEKGRFPAVITHAAPVAPSVFASGPPYSRPGNEWVEAEAIVAAPVIRRLTPVECLRLQGFPDDWFEGVPGYSDTKAYRAIGNSVAIPCVEWIFQRVLEFDKAQE